ncbi:MAG: hypothetical protein M9931_07380 [Chitinophagales bacterium]|nr:ComF family protein [Chitinophagales bacterium]MCO5280857.1 hypothetical protein [Chitinophagales bacterium]
MKPQLRQRLFELLQIVYPNLCLSCGQSLSYKQEFICTACLHSLPFTQNWKQENNSMEMHLWGRFAFHRACSLFYFVKNSGVQNLLHELKYRNQKELGIFLGEMLAEKMKESMSCDFDFVIPVPLHPQKERQRGYNQSQQFAVGIAKVFNCKADTQFLHRKHATETQTKKNLFQRLDNVASVFELNNPQFLKDKSVLLVDDVLTTGATIEACATTLNKVENLQLSIATIAIA